MVNERLDRALAWCKKNNVESTRLKKFNREYKKKRLKRLKKKRRKFLTEKAEYNV